MINTEGIEVYIKTAANSEPYKEYAKPGLTEFANTMQRNVEFELGKKIYVIVKIPANFEWPAPQMRITRILADTKMWCAHAGLISSKNKVPLISEFGRIGALIRGTGKKGTHNYSFLSLGSLFMPFR